MKKIDNYEPEIGQYNCYIFQKNKGGHLHITKKGDPMVKCINNRFYPLPFVNCFINEYSPTCYDYKTLWDRASKSIWWGLWIPYTVVDMLNWQADVQEEIDYNEDEKAELDAVLAGLD